MFPLFARSRGTSPRNAPPLAPCLGSSVRPEARLLLLLFLLVACGTGQAGDDCWSHYDCESQSCTFGTCDTTLVGLLLWLIEDAEPVAPQSPAPPPAPPSRPSCDSRSEASCAATDGCAFVSECSLSFACLSDPGFTTRDCVACVSMPGCPSPCQAVEYCR